MVRSWLARIALVSIALTATATLAAAAYTMTSGQTFLTVALQTPRGSCYVDRAPSTFSRGTGATKAYLTFGSLWAGGLYDLSGEASLLFTSATGGKILFGQVGGIPAGYQAPAFSGYSEVYNTTAKSLTVKFSIAFPACTLPVVAVYHTI